MPEPWAEMDRTLKLARLPTSALITFSRRSCLTTVRTRKLLQDIQLLSGAQDHQPCHRLLLLLQVAPAMAR